MDYRKRITRKPAICGGEPVIKGTRVTVRTILATLAEGTPTADILKDFPTLTEADVRAVIAFAAVSAEEDLPVPSIPGLKWIFQTENVTRWSGCFIILTERKIRILSPK